MKRLLLIPLFLLLGCAAPHDNPLDPKSDRYVTPVPEPEPIEFSVRVWSEHVSRIFPTSDLYQVRTELTNSNPDVQLDSVWLVYNAHPSIRLDSILTAARWGGNLSWTVFGCGQLMDCVIGQPFTFMARDARDSLYSTEPLYLFRVIAGTPATTEPDSGDMVGPRVTLEWPQFAASFPYGVRAMVVWKELLADSTTHDSTLWTSSLLPGEQRLVDIPDSLVDSDYEWTITVVDSFGNSSRSKEARFTVTFGGANE